MYFIRKIFLIPLMILLFSFSGQGEENERPTFKALYQEGKFSIRDYPRFFVIKTSDRRPKEMFSTLADYIFGENDRSEKIPMTVPVLSKTMRGLTTLMFYVPSFFETLNDLPRPTNPKVKLDTFDLGKVAVIAYGGYDTPEKDRKYFKKLKRWMKKRGLQMRKRGFYSAGYDAPEVPEEQRTNEVLIQIH